VGPSSSRVAPAAPFFFTSAASQFQVFARAASSLGSRVARAPASSPSLESITPRVWTSAPSPPLYTTSWSRLLAPRPVMFPQIAASPAAAVAIPMMLLSEQSVPRPSFFASAASWL
jgi:hypothetical protein